MEALLRRSGGLYWRWWLIATRGPLLESVLTPTGLAGIALAAGSLSLIACFGAPGGVFALFAPRSRIRFAPTG